MVAGLPVKEDLINVLIVDDEERACRNLSSMLSEYIEPHVNVSGIFHNTTEDLESQIEALRPDAIFLDIQMPFEDAFAFLDRIAPFDFEVIFVTAFDEYAVNAFRLNALDYVLKPISVPELQRAVSKLRERIIYRRQNIGQQPSYSSISQQIANRSKFDKLLLRDLNTIEVVSFENIIVIEAKGSYSKVVFLSEGQVKEMVVSTYLADFEEMLPAEMFFRAHRSFLFNVHHVRKIKMDCNEVLLHANYLVPVSRRRYPLLLNFLKAMGR